MKRRIIPPILAAVGIALIAVCNLAIQRHAIPSVEIAQLGLIQDHAEKASPIAATMPRFFISGANPAQDNSRANVRLWDWAKLANGGQHLRNYPQETGDCVAFGAKNAAEYFLAAAIGKGTLQAAFHPIFPPHIYGGSRVEVGQGKLGRSAGSVGAWAAEWVTRRGVLRADLEGVPVYGGKLADEWGYRGVPPKWVEASQPFVFETVSPVATAAEARDALCNGYPVTIASDFGTKTIKVQDGRRVAVRNGRWYHQMCLIGYDGSGSRPYFYCLNSWGDKAHPDPLQGEPPGGFWLTIEDVEYIVRQGDSFAFSGFAGFPAQPFVPDFRVIGAAGPAVVVQQEEMSAMFNLPADVQMPGTVLGIALIAIALVMLCLRGNGGRRCITAALLAAASLPAIAHAADPDFTLLIEAAQLTPIAETSEPFVPRFALLAEAARATKPKPMVKRDSVVKQAEVKKPSVTLWTIPNCGPCNTLKDTLRTIPSLQVDEVVEKQGPYAFTSHPVLTMPGKAPLVGAHSAESVRRWAGVK